MKIVKAKSFYDEMKITDKCTFTGGQDNTGWTVPGSNPGGGQDFLDPSRLAPRHTQPPL
jgi:hypothetical protein